MELTSGEVIKRLREQGLPISYGQLFRAVESGKVERPRQDGSGNFRWTEAHIQKLIEIFK
jgi:hypothetical protein